MCVIVVHSSLIKPLLQQATFPLHWHEFILFFQRAVRSQKKTIFFVKRAFHGILTLTKALLQGLHGILLHSNRVLVGNFLCFHVTHNACTALSRLVHCAEDAVTSQRTPYNLCANTMDDRRVCTMTLVHARRAPTVL